MPDVFLISCTFFLYFLLVVAWLYTGLDKISIQKAGRQRSSIFLGIFGFDFY